MIFLLIWDSWTEYYLTQKWVKIQRITYNNKSQKHSRDEPLNLKIFNFRVLGSTNHSLFTFANLKIETKISNVRFVLKKTSDKNWVKNLRFETFCEFLHWNQHNKLTSSLWVDYQPCRRLTGITDAIAGHTFEGSVVPVGAHWFYP